jgi:hypothetical protein
MVSVDFAQIRPSCPAEVPGIHEFPSADTDVDGRDKPGHDGCYSRERRYRL